MPTWSVSETGVIAAYLGVLAVLCVFGAHRFSLVWLVRRLGRDAAAPARVGSTLPSVTVQLPVMNERYVVERLIRSVAALDYPRDRLEIQVLDDSTDDTRELVARLCAELARGGSAIHHLHRTARHGFKAGALDAGLAVAHGELTLILDADFVLPADFLTRVVGHFADPRVGMVQARWSHLNGEDSMLASAQALMLDGHFAVQHRARAAAGRFFNFNGTAGIFRRAAIVAAGGWQHDTLTEDLDLSYRMQLAGYRGVYVDDVTVPGELPAAIGALKSQQHRWAKGSIQTCRKLLPRLWSSTAPLATKVEATFHLTDNFAYLLLLLLSLLSLPALAIRESHGVTRLAAVDAVVLMAGIGSLALFYAEAARRTGSARRLRRLPALMALGIGLSVNNSMAVVGGLMGVRSPFVRTPKTGGGRAAAGATYRPRRDLLFLVELSVGAWTALAVGYAIATEVYVSLPFLLLLTAGHLWVGGMSLHAYLRPTGR